MSIFKIFEFATSVSFILANVTVIISFAIFFILKRIRDNETKTNTLIGIVTDLTNEVKYTVNSRNISSGISSDFSNKVFYNDLNGIDIDNLSSLVVNEEHSNNDELDELDELDQLDELDDEDEYEYEDENEDENEDEHENKEENKEQDEDRNNDEDNNTNNLKIIEVDEDLDLANYLKMTVKELKNLVKEKKLHNDVSRLRKSELIELLQKQ